MPYTTSRLDEKKTNNSLPTATFVVFSTILNVSVFISLIQFIYGAVRNHINTEKNTEVNGVTMQQKFCCEYSEKKRSHTDLILAQQQAVSRQ